MSVQFLSNFLVCIFNLMVGRGWFLNVQFIVLALRDCKACAPSTFDQPR